MRTVFRERASSVPKIQNGPAHPSFPAKKALIEYNQSIGNHLALEHYKKELEHNPQFVITGHQLCFLGGPLFCLLKVISCLHLAKQIGAIPLFWLATEDHDINEVNHAYKLDSLGNLAKVRCPYTFDRRFVEDLPFDATHWDAVDTFSSQLPDALGHWRSDPAKRYSEVMAKFWVALFKDYPILFIEPHAVRQTAAPFFEKELEQKHVIQKQLHQVARGLNSSIKIPSSNLFWKDDRGHRQRVTEMHTPPLDRLSTGVLARCALQSWLFPTRAYIAGPSEMQYWALVEGLHTIHKAHMPSVLPRISATCVPSWAGALTTTPWAFDQEKIGKHDKHRLGNLINPKNRLQERVLSGFYFLLETKEDFISNLLQSTDYRPSGHYYCFLE